MRSRKRLRTVANTCRRLRSQTQNLANTASPPDPQVKREPSLRIREKDHREQHQFHGPHRSGHTDLVESLVRTLRVQARLL